MTALSIITVLNVMVAVMNIIVFTASYALFHLAKSYRDDANELMNDIDKKLL